MTRTTGFVPINIDLISEVGLHAIEQSAFQCMTDIYKCPVETCLDYNYYIYEFSKCIAIELNSDIKYNLKYKLEEFPTNLNFFGKMFSNPCLVDFLKNRKHYKVHCYSGAGNWLTYDDLENNIMEQSSNTSVLPHLVVYSMVE